VANFQVRSLISNVRSSRYARVTIAYAATAFILLQLADLLFDDLRLPAYSKLLLVAFLAIGLPIALAITWAVEPGRPAKRSLIAGDGQLSSLAVLPFADLSPGHDRKYLSCLHWPGFPGFAFPRAYRLLPRMRPVAMRAKSARRSRSRRFSTAVCVPMEAG
jgi:hypothetical protein